MFTPSWAATLRAYGEAGRPGTRATGGWLPAAAICAGVVLGVGIWAGLSAACGATLWVSLTLWSAEMVTPVSLALAASSTMKAMGWPTSTTLPTSAMGPERKPSWNTSTSMMALSVSTVATMSPRLICSPGFFSQVTTTPSVMVSESCGITMGVPAWCGIISVWAFSSTTSPAAMAMSPCVSEM